MSSELNRSYRPKEAAKLLGIGSATLWRWINERPGFPQPTRLSARCTVLDGEELRTWMAQQGSTPKRPPVVKREPALIPLSDLKWCQACGEGVTTFCRAKPSAAPTRTCGMGFTEFDAMAGFVPVRTRQTPYGEATAYRAVDDLQKSAQDNGPWQACKWGEKGWAVCSDQFAPHDACLVINGDFADDSQKRAYAEMIAVKLNLLRGEA